jgi:hypothetical protein
MKNMYTMNTKERALFLEHVDDTKTISIEKLFTKAHEKLNQFYGQVLIDVNNLNIIDMLKAYDLVIYNKVISDKIQKIINEEDLIYIPDLNKYISVFEAAKALKTAILRYEELYPLEGQKEEQDNEE